MSNQQLIEKSYFLECGRETLHLKRIFQNPGGITVFLMHGSVEDGRIYYSKSGKGLAPFLAKHGYDVFIPDLSGKGQSKPEVSKDSINGQTEAITIEIPLFLEKIRVIKGDKPQHWIGHSWGGTLQYAYLLRYPSNQNVLSMCHFGVKRRIKVRNWQWFYKIAFGWYFLGNILTKIYGFMPSKIFKFGSENEPKKFYYQINKWFKQDLWIDEDDLFNYSLMIEKVNLPPSRFFCGVKDYALGAKQDSELLIKELNIQDKSEVVQLGKKYGHNVNYDHNNCLIHTNCPNDHFPSVLDWFKRFE